MTRQWIIFALVLSLGLLMGGLHQTPKAQSSSVQTISTLDEATPQEEAFEGTFLQGQVVPVQAGLRVELSAMDSRVLDSARTDVNGSYRFAPLPRGAYQLRLFDQEERELLLTKEARVSIKPKRRMQQYNLQLALSDKGEVIRQRPIVETKVTLLEGGISGQVTAADTGQPLQNVSVYLYNGQEQCVDEGYDARLGSTTTDANGMYSFTGLAAGSYDVEFRPYGSAEAYLDDRQDQIQVSDGNVTELNVALERGGQISGQIIADGSGTPLADVYVNVYQYNADGDYYSYQGDGRSDENGVYTTEGLASGEYRLSISPSSSGGSTAYLEEYYNDQTSLSSATPVNVTVGQTTSDINVSLALGGQISGRVTAEDSGAALAEVDVNVYDADGSYMTYAWTDSNGVYTTGAVPTGNYRIKFETYSWSDSANYIDEYYNNQPTLNEGELIAVTVGNTTPNIDAQLALGGAISGLVTINTGQPFYDVEVSAYDSSGNQVTYDWTSSTGQYDLTGLPAGIYYVRFWDSQYFDGCLEVDYQGNYYNQKPDLASADPLTVSSGQTIENINAVLSADDTSPTPDTTLPTLNMPEQMTRLTTSPDGAVVTYQITASDNVDPNPTVACTPPSGSLFPMGATTVTCTATDASGNQASGSFTIMVIEASHQLHLPLVMR